MSYLERWSFWRRTLSASYKRRRRLLARNNNHNCPNRYLHIPYWERSHDTVAAAESRRPRWKEGQTMRITIVFFHIRLRPIASRHSLSCFIASSGRLCRNFWFGSRSRCGTISDVRRHGCVFLASVRRRRLLSARNCSRTTVTPTEMPRQPTPDKRTSRSIFRLRFGYPACWTGGLTTLHSFLSLPIPHPGDGTDGESAHLDRCVCSLLCKFGSPGEKLIYRQLLI